MGFASCVCAQIVNIEDKRKGFDTIGWFGQLDLGGTLNKNQNTVVTLNGGLRLDRVGRRVKQLILADYRLVQVSGDNALNAGFGHYRIGYELNDNWRWETFGQLQYSEQLKLRLRGLLGSGLRRRLLEADRGRGYLGVLLMYEYDELDGGRLIYQDMRLSNYLSLAVRLLPNVELSNTTYYQPILFGFRGRLSSVTNVTFSINERIAVTSNYSISHDARTAEDLNGVPSTTYIWKNGLRWRF